jgi:hypothetical protein
MQSKASAIQEQLERAQGRKGTETAAPEQAPPRRVSKPTNSRDGKIHLGTYLDPDFRKSFHMIQAQTGKDMQALIAEAFNDLFRKYKVPVVGA